MYSGIESWHLWGEELGLGVGLSANLAVAVPLRIQEFQAQGGPPDAATLPPVDRADELISPGPHERAQQYRRLVDALAVLAFQPGGVRFCDNHFEAKASPRIPNRDLVRATLGQANNWWKQRRITDAQWRAYRYVWAANSPSREYPGWCKYRPSDQETLTVLEELEAEQRGGE